MILSEPVLVDTGALLAIYNVHDADQAACVEQAEALPIGESFTCWPVVTEGLYMLRKYPDRLGESSIDTSISEKITSRTLGFSLPRSAHAVSP